MQPKFTPKGLRLSFKKNLLVLIMGLSFLNAFSQTTITTTYAGTTFLTGDAVVTFAVVNGNATPRWLTALNMEFNTVAGTGTSNLQLWVSTTSLSGAPTVTTPVWTLVASNTVTISNGVIPIFSGLSYNMAPTTSYRFAVRSSNGLIYGGATSTPNNFAGDGVTLGTGNYQIAGLNVGYTGAFPTGANNPRFYSGSITVQVPPAPCSGTPTPGNTLSTVSTVCPGVNFTLSLQNATAGSGVTYQWQSASALAGPYTNIPGATSATLITNLTAATFYQCVVTCGANNGTSTPVSVALTPPSGCYCIPGATDCTDDDVILRVRISTLDNASTCGTGPPAGYSNYTTTVAAPILYAGAPNPLTVDVPTTFTEFVGAWIDFNKNGVFEASEFTNLGNNAGGGTLVGNISIPASTPTGVTRMRVRVRFATVLGNTQSCLPAYTFGETEDYNVNIQPCVPAAIVSAPASVSTVCGNNASFTVNATGSLLTYSWQFRTSAAAPWQVVPAAAPYSGTNTATLALTNVSAAFSGYQYRALVAGGCSAVDFTSPPATLTVNPIVPTVTPASATICVGSVQQLTLTNTLGNTDLITEGFNTAAPLPAGWASQNNSTPVGTTGWFQGNTAVFPAQSGAPDSYIGANFNNVAGANTISNWLMTPAVAIKNGDVLRFWSRTISGPTFPDRLEVRLNSTNTTNVGATNVSVGDFTTLLLTINPTLTPTGYPDVWTQYTVTVSGLGAPIPAGRFAFRYFVTNGGPAGANSDYIGIDNVVFTSAGGPASGIWTGPAGTMWTNAGATTAYTGTPATTIWVTPTVTSNYQVNFTTLTPCTSATTTVPVNVVTPVVLGTNPVNRTVCVGGSTSYSVTATGGPITYQWQVSTDGGLTYSNISGATAATLNLTGITQSMNGNRYRCVLNAAPCVGATTSAAATLTVNPLPIVTLSSTDLLLVPGQFTSITASSSPAAASGGWVWTYNGSTIAGNTTNTVSGIGIDQTGTYHATVTDVNGCVNTSADIVVGSEASDHLWIYPNPTPGAFQVRLYYDPSSISERRAVYIYNAKGQLMQSREISLVSSSAPYTAMNFDLSNVAPGTYVVKVVDKNSGRIVSGLVVNQ